ncbi:MAG: hypothetical protein H6P99_1649 [Holophagaceae bacterium]|nr:hypothetical protein [Holophagaceae bacterium]
MAPLMGLEPPDHPAPIRFAPELPWPPGSQTSPAFTPDGRTVFFTQSKGEARAIMVSRLRNGRWSKPDVASFSGRWRDIEPAMAPDGSYLVFISNRPATPEGEPLTGFWGGASRPGAGGNLWRVDRAGDGWGEPRRLPEVVNSHSAIYSPAVAANGNLYFNQPDPVTRKSHIYVARAAAGGYLPATPLPISDGSIGDFDAAVAPDESFLVFSSGRPPAGPGQAILFITYRRGDQWTPPRALEPTAEGLEARLSPDLKTLYYSPESPSAGTGLPDGGVAPSRIYQMPLERHLQKKDH